jgi:hypothetical protein
LLSTVAIADEEKICDYEHKCYSGTTKPPPPPQIYHMDPTHPDKVTPPPAPQYPGIVPKPYVDVAPHPHDDGTAEHLPVIPEEIPPHYYGTDDHTIAEVPTYNPDPDCENMRNGLFPTPEAAAAARAHCGE